MTDNFQTGHVIEPITALAFTQCGSSFLLLAGEGSFLRIFSPSSSHLLLSKRLFRTQSIHGISSCNEGARAASRPTAHLSTFLVWAGRSLCLVQIDIHVNQKGSYELRCDILGKEILLSDWILDACFWPITSAVLPGATRLSAVILTSHNALFALSLHRSADLNNVCTVAGVPFATGPRCMLYSGHLFPLESDWLLIASGTVFGEALVWACDRASYLSTPDNTVSGHLLYCFSGHDGSIFGVRISEPFTDRDKNESRRVLASCSDDRTIRLWDISNIMSEISRTCEVHDPGSFSLNVTEPHISDREPEKSRCLARVIGHASRIWGLRFLASGGPSLRLISYGEDSCTQIWCFDHESTPIAPFGTVVATLRLEASQRYHIGKNIWAVATSAQKAGSCLIFTGGADGRIVSSVFESSKSQSNTNFEQRFRKRGAISIDVSPSRFQVDETGNLATPTHLDTPVSRIFSAMQGSWDLNRILKSAISTYPSGIFKGTAKLISRTPTDTAYDAEHLYTEEGQLQTEQGFSLQGNRRYVYRFQRTQNEITAWFVKPGTEAAVDYLFHSIGFQGKDLRRLERTGQSQIFMQKGSGYHLCVEDEYKAEYSFSHDCGVLEEWAVRYDVMGPKKDYSADAKYTRSLADKEKAAEKIRELAAREKLGIHNGPNPNVIGARPTNGLPKSYSWINKYAILATTATGQIMIGTLSRSTTPESACTKDISWEEIAQLTDLESYSLTTDIKHTERVLLSGKQGVVYLYQNHQKSVNPIINLPCKVSSLFTQELHGFQLHKASHDLIGIIAACLGSPTAYMCTMQLNGTLPTGKYSISELVTLKLPSHFVVTSAQWIGLGSYLALGSRSGALCIYKYPECTTSKVPVDPFPCFRHVHGEDAITSIQNLPAYASVSASKIYFLTTGRNGKCAIHYLLQRSVHLSIHLRLETVHVLEPPFGPNIEGGLFDSLTNDLIIWGFRSKTFVVWNDSKQKELMEIECGGSHRSWAYRQNGDGKEDGALIWTQASICNVRTQEQASHQVIQAGGHGREIKAIASYQADGQKGAHAQNIIATGAEDTTVRISISKKDGSTGSDIWVCRGIMKSHTTGIQQLRWTPNGSFLFSAGGCEELFVWRVRPVPCIDIGIVLFSRCPPVTEDADLRIMDFDIIVIEDDESTVPECRFLVTVVYSDSSIRIWRFDPASLLGNFEHLHTGTYNTCCLTQVRMLQVGIELIIFTASTDGHVVFWPLRKVLEVHNRGEDMFTGENGSSKKPLIWTQRHQIHQSSIKCMEFLRISEEDIIIATGGDDNSMALTRLTSPTKEPFDPAFSTLRIPRAHASTITSIQHVPPPDHEHNLFAKDSYRIATSSNDQRLKFWLLSMDISRPGIEGLNVMKENNLHSRIADASCMAIAPGIIKGTTLVIAGIGLEMWKIND